MSILITGANGFLGHHLCEQLLNGGYKVVATSRGASQLPFAGREGFMYVPMDFTDPFSVHDVFEKHKPVVVVHAGAMTKVDQCELEQWQAYLTNVEGTVTLLLNAEERKSFFIFLSTDFVFAGDTGSYTEEDPTAPVNFYGKTKAEAEEAVKEYEYDWAIVRTSLVYGKPTGDKPNVLTVVKDKLDSQQSYSVVDDQVRTPTYVGDLAAGVAAMIERKATGIYHISGRDILTPYNMAIKVAEHFQLDNGLLKKVTATDFSQPALRPLKTNLVIDKARKKLGYQPLRFEEGLRKTFSD